MGKLEIEKVGLPSIRDFGDGPIAFWQLDFDGRTGDEPLEGYGESVTISVASAVDLAGSLHGSWSAARLRIIARLEEALALVTAAELYPAPVSPPETELHATFDAEGRLSGVESKPKGS